MLRLFFCPVLLRCSFIVLRLWPCGVNFPLTTVYTKESLLMLHVHGFLMKFCSNEMVSFFFNILEMFSPLRMQHFFKLSIDFFWAKFRDKSKVLSQIFGKERKQSAEASLWAMLMRLFDHRWLISFTSGSPRRCAAHIFMFVTSETKQIENSSGQINVAKLKGECTAFYSWTNSIVH